ncbi:MAG: Lrp/AsnC family transcriptional regulator [Cytophagales bacterium]|nr:Lrp/AsnC family transcriptional regulator [Cytophagales bacterium]
MTKVFKLDKIDKRILDILQKNSKLTNAKLAQMIGLSAAPTLERVKKLEQAGVITGYHARLDRKKIGLHVITLALVSLKEQNRVESEKFVESVLTFPEIVSCYYLTGMADFLIKVVITDFAAYEDLIGKINKGKGFSIQTLVVIDVKKQGEELFIPK